MKDMKRGDIYYADLNPVVGSEQGGVRPVLNVQNNVGNRFSPTVIVAAVTSNTNKAPLPTHIAVRGGSCGLEQDSTVLLEQLRTLDKSRLLEYVGSLDEQSIIKINAALAVSVGLQNVEGNRYE